MRSATVELPAGAPTWVCSIPWNQPGQLVQNTGTVPLYVDARAQVDNTGVQLAPGAYFTFPGEAMTSIGVWALAASGAGQITVLTPG